jgi:hypothetical protein
MTKYRIIRKHDRYLLQTRYIFFWWKTLGQEWDKFTLEDRVKRYLERDEQNKKFKEATIEVIKEY